MTPVSIRLCEVMGLNPVPILMAMIIYSNVGGALTPGNRFAFFFLSKICTIYYYIFETVGDPPNVIIASNAHIVKGVSSNHKILQFTANRRPC